MDQPLLRSPGLGKLSLRVIVEGLIWLPLWLVYSVNLGISGKLATFAGILGFFIVGLFLYRFPPLWRRLAMIAIFVVLLSVGIGRYTNDLPVFIGMCVLIWRGRFLTLRHWNYGLAFGVCCVAHILTSRNEAWADDRLVFIVLAVGWVIVWFYALNRSLINEAGIHDGIVTRPVRMASRKYLMIFLAVGLVVIALTASYGQQWLTPKQVINPNNSWIDPDRFIPPPQTMENPPGMEELTKEKGKKSVLWDIFFWIMTAVAAFGAIWFIRLLWKDRTWTLQKILQSIREWLLREKKAEKLPYVEERRSIREGKKKGAGLIDSLFRRQRKQPAWEQLSNPEKVRRLYEEAVVTGIGQGYAFNASLTPAETLEGIERWQADEAKPDNDKNASYWKRLLNIRAHLLELYEKAKYSPHEVTEQEAADLKDRVSGGGHRHTK
ncbi:hypothetical protein [Cohnella herbarum]|uniref:DUF4129 domain-containing protein n=1 Tax=Cohnella herbarum TaxID=2728023 RepID=A0A7Z2VNC2_9BACL|nr:hypothetical protein [Cohnella herbarum]QJD86162.1 hypothetical protein HH215_25275 [Cohnella herbarum]